MVRTRCCREGRLQLAGFPVADVSGDVYDHILRVSEWADSLRDLLANIMKKASSWAAIIAVPTAVTGFYGQNLPYPRNGQQWGVIASAVVMVGGSVVLYVTFKIKDWL